VAIAASDFTIAIVDDELGLLVAADFPPPINRNLLGLKMSARPFGTAAPDIPSAIGVWNDMVAIAPFCHITAFYVRVDTECIATPNKYYDCHSPVKRVKCAYTEHQKPKEISHLSNILGQKIRKLRKDRQLTLDKLAELTESSKSYIWELENNNPPRPSAEKLAKIADKLGTTLEFLLDKDQGVTEEDAADARFYRHYQKMDPATKAKIRQMVKLWGDEE
jgi:transcriptional regulator with XRE-family HTH domain